MKIKIKTQRGFSLVEIIVVIGIMAILSSAIYGFFVAMRSAISNYREKVVISSLADQYLEIARNLPYSDIGTISGNPNGGLPDLPNPKTITVDNRDYQVYYAISYVDDPADGTFLLGTDFSPQDYKQVKLYVKNTLTNSLNYFLTNIAPEGVEGLGTGGALHIKVFDSVGQPVPGATIHITNSSISPAIDLTRTADSNGLWLEVGLTASANSYHISAYKSGYSTDQTHPSTTENPNPVKPDSTVSVGEITTVSFSIDKTSDLTFQTLSQACQALGNISLQVRGSKIIGTSPDVYKFDNSYNSGSYGQVTLSDIEWDNYSPTILSSLYMIYGSAPDQQITVLPNTEQTFSLMLGPKTDNSLLITVKDSSTPTALEGVNLELSSSGAFYNQTKITGGSAWLQQSWSGGADQDDFEDQTKYYSDDGNVSTSETPEALRLIKTGGDYATSGYLISSTFDTGTDQTEYSTLTWQPTSQDPSTSIKFQIAANNDNLTWNFSGPDGSSDTYYQTPGQAISSSNNSRRYVRYKVFLATEDTAKTPALTSVNLNYVSGCFTPGQAMFAGLQSAEDYQITATANGYVEKTISDIIIEGYNNLQILLEKEE